MIPVLEDIIRGLLDGTMSKEEAKFYLDRHVEMQGEVDGLSDVPYSRGRVTLDVLTKCIEQDQQWGERQYPSFNLAIVNDADLGQYALAGFHEVVNGQRARILTNSQATLGELSWMTILVEEVAKLTEKYESPEALREQVIDVAGVAVQWASQLTPDPEFTVETSDNGDGTVSLTAHVEADHEGPNLR